MSDVKAIPATASLPTGSQPRHFFIMPPDGIGAVPSIHIGGEDGKPTHQVSADACIKAFEDVEFWRQQARSVADSLNRERAKIGRLMAAIADELTK